MSVAATVAEFSWILSLLRYVEFWLTNNAKNLIPFTCNKQSHCLNGITVYVYIRTWMSILYLATLKIITVNSLFYANN